ncbi:hypothetical protein CW368_11830 [Actinomycetales bacterium SN12]|nr:hypothetical protein CW368_11830 [Actinomycetales bacterium SN12]
MTDSTSLPTNQATHEGHDFRTAEAVRPLTIEDAVDEVLRPIVSEHHAAEVADALRKRAAQLLRRESPRNVGPTSQERSYLIDSGAFTPEALSESEQRVTRGELHERENRSELEAIAATYSETEVAARFKTGVGNVIRRYRDGALIAFDIAGNRLYPTWQFTDSAPGGVLPHLSRVLVALQAEERNPASTLAFMTVPKEGLASEGEKLSPVQWLLRGGSFRALERVFEAESQR